MTNRTLKARRATARGQKRAAYALKRARLKSLAKLYGTRDRFSAVKEARDRGIAHTEYVNVQERGRIVSPPKVQAKWAFWRFIAARRRAAK
jgi:hypothetical protein